MNKISKEVEQFLFDLGFEKCNLNNISFNYYIHKFYKRLSIQRNTMILDSSLYKEKISVDIEEWNKESLLMAYSECIELHGMYRGENSIRHELLNVLGIKDLLEDMED